MSTAGWYWHRLRAMDVSEIASRIRKKIRSYADQRTTRNWGEIPLETNARFPRLPDRKAAPPDLDKILAINAEEVINGRWLAFGRLPLSVDHPPRWQTDYLVAQNLQTDRSAFQLDHRQLPNGADIKLIWELSRWCQLVRLAQAAWLLEEEKYASTCVTWLTDWAEHNGPFLGWNWTSGLESGIRLIQFTWIHSLLEPIAKKLGFDADLERLKLEILPPHAWFTWRHRSFGSSANNHLLGELSGLIVAMSRWPGLESWSTSLGTLKGLWEQEILAQFGEDGGNLEQALNYHLFSFEFAWQARAALIAADRGVNPRIDERLSRARKFFLDVQVEGEAWDYGDSDSAYVTPFFGEEESATKEWYRWLQSSKQSPNLRFWLGDHGLEQRGGSPATPAISLKGEKERAPAAWHIYPDAGIAVRHEAEWFLRFDLSPLGYLSTAAHGHLDALHLSIWFRGKALVIDPGTGAYYADPKIRNYLASWEAHNGPHRPDLDRPRRLGPFLWADHHERPEWSISDEARLIGRLSIRGSSVKRTISPAAGGDGWVVEDASDSGPILVRWQFPPGTQVQPLPDRTFRVERDGLSVGVRVDECASAELLEAKSNPATEDLRGICSPFFRRIERGPRLELLSDTHKPCVLRTTFLALTPS